MTADLIETHRGLVFAIAHQQHAHLGGDVDELVGDGMVGLVEAAGRWNPDRGVSLFSTFARHRIRGAMIDGFRHRNRTTQGRHGGERLEVLTPDGIVYDQVGEGSAEDQVLDRLALGRILEKVGELTARQQAVVGVAIRGARFDAYAEQIGVSSDAVAQRLCEARKSLRRRLAA